MKARLWFTSQGQRAASLGLEHQRAARLFIRHAPLWARDAFFEGWYAQWFRVNPTTFAIEPR